ncbi:hypothetical protein ACFV7R_45730 [Streptomyces sp. NPDC059866]|uniref:hypothetical protein n=1 Tax=Streptomyces sp. NPDC059866 TaxID=3346978 RepID=UPI0036644749
MEKLIDLLVNATVAFLAWRLANLSRDRADREAEKATLRAQADALTVAVIDLRQAAATNRILWEGPAERGRSFLLALLSYAGGVARAQALGASDRLALTAGLGNAAETLAGDRRASKEHIATVREPLLRLATAAAPLLRHQDENVAAATNALTAAALAEAEDTTRVETALAAFENAVRAALEPTPSRWARLRRRGRRATTGA